LSSAERERLAGWEWVPETALRCAGFFSSDRTDARRELGCVAVLDSLALRSLSAAARHSRAESEPGIRQFARAG
jgi:hypothetical protein